MANVAQLLITGIACGFIYALVAIEYTLIWNACGFLNFAHAKIIMLSAYFFAGTFQVALRELAIPAAGLAVIAILLVGVIVAFIIFIPLRRYTRLVSIMATVMLGMAINQAAVLLWGSAPLSSGDFLTGIITVGEVTISRAYVATIVVAVAVSILLRLFINKTKPGQAMTCVAQDKTTAALMGIDVKRNMAMSVILSFAICALIGILCAPIYTVQQTMADMIGLKGFSAGVVGGFGSVNGAILGGLVVGILENVGCLVVPSLYKDVIAFAVMIAVMMVRPYGLIGQQETRSM
jgi:branched-chain amino acid transport system permease protein